MPYFWYYITYQLSFQNTMTEIKEAHEEVVAEEEEAETLSGGEMIRFESN